MATKTPLNLYKYLSFNENTIENLIMQEAYYSDPVNFNDPLDCRPVITVDVEQEVLERVVCNLIRRRSEKEFVNLAKKLKVKKELIHARVAFLTESEVKSFLNEVYYYSTEYGSETSKDYIREKYRQTIEEEISSTFKRGVLCLSKKFNSPLMWSHYANNHRGLCVEYDMKDVDEGHAKKIIYGGSRSLKVSLIDTWLTNGQMPQEIENVCLLTKSGEWSYENEWRIFGRIGVAGVEPTIKSIIFGMHCKDTTIALVVNSLVNARQKMKFWKMYNPGNDFKLVRERIDVEEYKEKYSNIYSYGEIKRALED